MVESVCSVFPSIYVAGWPTVSLKKILHSRTAKIPRLRGKIYTNTEVHAQSAHRYYQHDYPPSSRRLGSLGHDTSSVRWNTRDTGRPVWTLTHQHSPEVELHCLKLKDPSSRHSGILSSSTMLRTSLSRRVSQGRVEVTPALHKRPPHSVRQHSAIEPTAVLAIQSESIVHWLGQIPSWEV